MVAGNLYVSLKEPMMVISSPTGHRRNVWVSGPLQEGGLLATLTDLHRRPRHTVFTSINAIDDQFSTPAHIVDRILHDFDAPRRLDDNVESVWILALQLLELGRRVFPRKFDILVRRIERLGEIHLQALGS